MKRRRTKVSKALVDHVGLLFKVGVRQYVDMDLIREVRHPEDRARLHRMIKWLEEGRCGE